MLIISQKNFFDSLSSILNLKMTSRWHRNVMFFLACIVFYLFLINIILLFILFFNQYYIFKQIWTKRTTGKLDSSHSGIQIQVRNQFIYQSSSPLDNKILYKLINVKQFTWSYDCLYKLPPVHQYLYLCCIMNHGINSHERKLQWHIIVDSKRVYLGCHWNCSLGNYCCRSLKQNIAVSSLCPLPNGLCWGQD